MRITSNLFPETFKQQTQYLQARQLEFQRQIATGLRIEKSSDDPLAFQLAQIVGESTNAQKSYLNNTSATTTLGEYNHTAMTDIYKLLTRAQELATRANNVYAATERSAIGQEMSGILDQIVTVANRQKDGAYLFGSTGNLPPIITADQKTVAGPATVSITTPTGETVQLKNYAFNDSNNYTDNVTSSEISKGNVVETGFLAGRNSGPTNFDGFLTDGTGARDLLMTLTKLRDTLMAGGAVMGPADPAIAAKLDPLGLGGTTVADSTDVTALYRGSDRVAEYVGRSAARLSAMNLNKAALEDQLKYNEERTIELTDVSLTDAIADLNKVQLHYQGALQSGGRILQVSLLDYVR
jgi:flagellar hook-associated protein 3 FlgL